MDKMSRGRFAYISPNVRVVLDMRFPVIGHWLCGFKVMAPGSTKVIAFFLFFHTIQLPDLEVSS